jgi:hypothetical protein
LVSLLDIGHVAVAGGAGFALAKDVYGFVRCQVVTH